MPARCETHSRFAFFFLRYSPKRSPLNKAVQQVVQRRVGQCTIPRRCMASPTRWARCLRRLLKKMVPACCGWLPRQPPTTSRNHFFEEPSEASGPPRRGGHATARNCALANPALHHLLNCFVERGALWGIPQKKECKSRVRFASGWHWAGSKASTWSTSWRTSHLNADFRQRPRKTAD